jgi:hypothetical protein
MTKQNLQESYAGENDSDYNTDSDEYKEEEDSRLPYLDGDDREEDNPSDTDDDEFQLIPIVRAIAGTNTSEKEQEDQTKVKDDGRETQQRQSRARYMSFRTK